MIFYNNVQVDSGSDTYSKGRFPKLKAYVGPVVGSNGEDLFDGYFALNNYDVAYFNYSGSATSSIDLSNDDVMNFFVFWPFTSARLAIQAYGWQLT